MRNNVAQFPEMMVRVRELNNETRETLAHGDERLINTAGISQLPSPVQQIILMATRFYRIDVADLSNGEARFGAFKCQGHFVYWRIDYRDAANLAREATYIANPRLTARILTVGLAT